MVNLERTPIIEEVTQEVYSDCEAFGLKKHGSTRPGCIGKSNYGTINFKFGVKILLSSDDDRLNSCRRRPALSLPSLLTITFYRHILGQGDHYITIISRI